MELKVNKGKRSFWPEVTLNILMEGEDGMNLREPADFHEIALIKASLKGSLKIDQLLVYMYIKWLF